jgi:hypothetical protein
MQVVSFSDIVTLLSVGSGHREVDAARRLMLSHLR